MSYKIIDNTLVENKTDITIIQSKDRKTLVNMKRHLCMGGGFNGFTPAFFLNKPGVK